MKRRTLLSGLMAAPALPLLTANAQAADAFHESTVQALDLSPDYWRDKVSEAAAKSRAIPSLQQSTIVIFCVHN